MEEGGRERRQAGAGREENDERRCLRANVAAPMADRDPPSDAPLPPKRAMRERLEVFSVPANDGARAPLGQAQDHLGALSGDDGDRASSGQAAPTPEDAGAVGDTGSTPDPAAAEATRDRASLRRRMRPEAASALRACAQPFTMPQGGTWPEEQPRGAEPQVAVASRPGPPAIAMEPATVGVTTPCEDGKPPQHLVQAHGLGDDAGVVLDPVPWGPEIVTLMIRRIPRAYTQRMLLEEVCGRGYSGLFDFLYLPCDLKKGVNVGYGLGMFGGLARGKVY